MEIINDIRNNDLNLMKATELRLGLPGTSDEPEKQSLKSNKRSSSEIDQSSHDHTDIDSAPASKAQVIGWPPIRSHRKHIFKNDDKASSEKSGMYVKVSMDGAPYLRKIDLRIYKSYMDLHKSLEIMFKCSINGGCYEMLGGCIMNINTCGEYVPTYQDKDGDWMMVGDVPWDMFVSSCTRMRIMKGFQAKGFRCS